MVILDDLTEEIAYQPMIESITKAMGKITIAKQAIKNKQKKEVKLRRMEAAFIKRMLDHWIESADIRYIFAKTAEQKQRISEANDIAILTSAKIGKILQ